MKSNTIRKKYISSLEGLPYMLNIEMVAGLTGLNYETIKRLCQKGVIKANKIGRERRITQDEFLNIGSNRKVEESPVNTYNNDNKKDGG